MSKYNTLQSLAFGSKEINYELSFKERKTLGIRVYPDGTVRVIAPLDASNENICHKLKQKAPWIIKQQHHFLSYHPLTPPRKYVSGETHLYLGRQYRLRLQKASTNAVKLCQGRLMISKNERTSAENLLTAWYKTKATIHFHAILQEVLPLFQRYNIQQPQLHIRNMSTRWGSCTPQGKIILNPDLIKAPKKSITYVIIHELCHLIHRRHTKAFYELQSAITPTWKKWKERLEHTLS